MVNIKAEYKLSPAFPIIQTGFLLPLFAQSYVEILILQQLMQKPNTWIQCFLKESSENR